MTLWYPVVVRSFSVQSDIDTIILHVATNWHTVNSLFYDKMLSTANFGIVAVITDVLHAYSVVRASVFGLADFP